MIDFAPESLFYRHSFYTKRMLYVKPLSPSPETGSQMKMAAGDNDSHHYDTSASRGASREHTISLTYCRIKGIKILFVINNIISSDAEQAALIESQMLYTLTAAMPTEAPRRLPFSAFRFSTIMRMGSRHNARISTRERHRAGFYWPSAHFYLMITIMASIAIIDVSDY